jgi:protein tyrosine phosphatase type 4A
MLSANNIVSNSVSSATRLPNQPALLQHKSLSFLIMDAPSQSNLRLYLQEMQRAHVKHVVRVCEPTYSKEIVEAAGIQVHDWVFPDGESPPAEVIERWLSLVDSMAAANERVEEAANFAVAVHCVAGLGRAPVLVAIALIEHGMSALDAVSFVRMKRRGAINNKQLKFLEKYQPRRERRLDKCTIQ